MKLPRSAEPIGSNDEGAGAWSRRQMAVRSIIQEGDTKLSVPTASLGVAEPPTSPVFFNPAAAFNRDVSVAVTEASGGRRFLDSLAGVGARGVRVANEVARHIDVTLVDFNEKSLGYARRSVRLNGVESKCSVIREEANVYLHSRYGRDERFDYVDVDPFGTPVPFVQGAVKATADGGLISVTATDTAVLCGVYPNVCRRRYSSTPLSNHFRHETGLRILLNYCRRTAASLDIGISPVMAHSTRHYMRVYARIDVGATEADRSAGNEGFVSECRSCRHLSAAGSPSAACEKCGGKVRVAGPLWIGSLADEGLARKAAAACRKKGIDGAARALESLEGVSELPPYGYSVESMCSDLKVPGVSELRVIEALEKQGHPCRRQPFEKTGLKSSAGYGQVVAVVKELAESGRR